jgi:hypothetical protein
VPWLLRGALALAAVTTAEAGSWTAWLAGESGAAGPVGAPRFLKAYQTWRDLLYKKGSRGLDLLKIEEPLGLESASPVSKSLPNLAGSSL